MERPYIFGFVLLFIGIAILCTNRHIKLAQTRSHCIARLK